MSTETMPIHDLGCRCWPHVSEKDAVAAIVEVARLEYREGLQRIPGTIEETDSLLGEGTQVGGFAR